MLPAVLSVALLAGAGGGCVLPPPLDEELHDARINAPPIILEARDSALNPLRPPQTVTVDRASEGSIGLTLYDVDVDQILYVRLFVDYDPADPTAPVVGCPNAVPTADRSPTRGTTCTTNGLCPINDPNPLSHRLEIEVYDAEPVLERPYRPAPGGLYSTWTFQLACVEP